MPGLPRLLDQLEAHYGPQHPACPTDPYLFLIWWHCGYPASDAACMKGWDSLHRTIGGEPEQILRAPLLTLTAALKPGGMVPDVRALRLKEIADAFHSPRWKRGEIGRPDTARTALKKLPGIGDPGADRILLFANISPIAAVPSNAPQVAVRMLRGKEGDNYGRNYSESQELISAEIPEDFAARQRAYLLLKQHGQQICKRTGPKCPACPIVKTCTFATSSRPENSQGRTR